MLPFFSLGPGRHFFSNGTEHGYCTFFDRQHTVNPFVAVVVVVVVAIVVIVVFVVDVVVVVVVVVVFTYWVGLTV